MVNDAQVSELKNVLPSAQNILIALPAGANIDKIASGLALYLSLTQAGKQVSIVSPDAMRVAESYLFAVDRIGQNIPQTGEGNLASIKLEGVQISPEAKVPALEKLDWHPEGNNVLSLDFSVVAGQTFKPTVITPQYQGGSFNLIVTVGASDLNSLGNIYSQNPQAFSSAPIVNLDNQPNNTNFGRINLVDQNAACVSEIMVSCLTSLGLPFDSDEASNLLSGIFEATNNLTSASASAETYMAVANCLRVGGRKPAVVAPQAQVVSQPQPQPAQQPAPQPGLDLSALIPPQQPQQPPVNNQETFVNPPVAPQPSPEERPAVERVVSEGEAEPEWLTPKIFKGGGVG